MTDSDTTQHPVHLPPLDRGNSTVDPPTSKATIIAPSFCQIEHSNSLVARQDERNEGDINNPVTQALQRAETI